MTFSSNAAEAEAVGSSKPWVLITNTMLALFSGLWNAYTSVMSDEVPVIAGASMWSAAHRIPMEAERMAKAVAAKYFCFIVKSLKVNDLFGSRMQVLKNGETRVKPFFTSCLLLPVMMRQV